MADVVSKIMQVIEPSLTSMGYELVQVKLADGKRSKTLSIMAERADAVSMSFDDCTEITRTVSALLEVEDPINSAYDLEVCSPGIDRPLTKLVDFTRFCGHEAKVETMIPVEGRKRFRGEIKGVKGEVITLTMPEKNEISFPFAHVKTAKLVLTDTLVKKNAKK
jgi:ribosome maturation factor RimP